MTFLLRTTTRAGLKVVWSKCYRPGISKTGNELEKVELTVCGDDSNQQQCGASMREQNCFHRTLEWTAPHTTRSPSVWDEPTSPQGIEPVPVAVCGAWGVLHPIQVLLCFESFGCGYAQVHYLEQAAGSSRTVVEQRSLGMFCGQSRPNLLKGLSPCRPLSRLARLPLRFSIITRQQIGIH